MTDDQHGEGTPQGGGRWNPLPQGDYDDGATAFVELPEGGIDALLSGDSPLAAPGHGYVPPRITATQTDGATGTWPAPGSGGRWPDANTAPAQPQGTDDRFTYQPAATQQWVFDEPAAPAAPGHDVTGQWSIPVAGGDLPDESGEFTASSLVEQWGGGTPPATLPGGAAAPWATDAAGRPWGRPPAQPAAPEADRTALPDHTGAHPAGSTAAPQAYAPETGYGHGPGYGHGTGYADAGPAEGGHADAGAQKGFPDADLAEGGYPDTGSAEGGHRDAGPADSGHPDAGHAGTGHPDTRTAEGGYRDAGPADSGHVDAGHAGTGHPDTRIAEGGYPDAGPADSGHPDAGHAGTGHPDTRTAEGGYRDAGPADSGHVDAGPAGTGHVDARQAQPGHADAGDGGTPGGTATPGDAVGPGGTSAPADAAPATRPQAEPRAVPQADAHGLAEAPERPADAPAGHEQHVSPADAPAAATAAVTADPAAPEAPVTTAHPQTPAGPEATDRAAASAGTPGPAPAADPAEAATEDGTAVPESPEAASGEGDRDPEESEAPEPGREAVSEGASEGAEDPAAVPLPPHDDHPLASYVLRVNGTDRPVTDAWIGESLLYVLRERLGLAGAKDGCSQGECGACNVQVDGRLVASCLVPAVTAAGSEVRTVEGLAQDGQPSDVQRALARCGAVQCGFCVPGMAMTVHDLLEGNPAPTELESRQALCGNLCRCSGYRGVLEAVKEVVAEREGTHAGPETDANEARIPHQAGPGSGGVHTSAFDVPGVFDTPHATPDGHPDAQGAAYGDTPDPYGADAPDPYGTPPGQHDQHYGQDGGQA
ncbi:2Fe-2S iron-sulfur cluster-binding protein [Streptomyces sp. NPDC042638]|uniref:2Fe-2S iron-sulfur cluster-binding protein n=1 Tax=Streptomyces sp. NPDC042638 TaxID=3154333 RepID=UPI0033ED2473